MTTQSISVPYDNGYVYLVIGWCAIKSTKNLSLIRLFTHTLKFWNVYLLEKTTITRWAIGHTTIVVS